MSESANPADELAEQYATVRKETERLCRPLAVDDYGIQPMPDASPPKWHLAHTTWFFETFLLKPFHDGYTPFDDAFEFLFNSYYNGVGEQYPRPRRGLLSRPTVERVFDYRAHVDAAMQDLLAREDEMLGSRTVLGMNHEQQHQELIVTDIKYNLGTNPLRPRMTADSTVGPARRARRRSCRSRADWWKSARAAEKDSRSTTKRPGTRCGSRSSRLRIDP